MAEKNPFWKTFAATLKMRGPAKTLAGLALAGGGYLLAALVRAGKRAADFRQPALPGCDPAPGQDLPALPPPGVPDPKLRKIVRKAPSPFVRSLDAALRTSSDWTRSPHPIWMWLSGGGLKGFLGARRFWAGLVRHVFDGFGRVGWTFMTIVVVPLEFATRRAAQMSTAFSDFRRMRDYHLTHPGEPPQLYLPHRLVRRRIILHAVLPPVVAGVTLLIEMIVLDLLFGIPTPLYWVDAFVSLGAIFAPILTYQWCCELPPKPLLPHVWPAERERILWSSRTTPFAAALTIPSLGQAAPGSLGNCLLYTLFGPAAGQNTCSQTPLASLNSGPAAGVLAAIPASLATVGTLVSSLAIFLLTLVYTYHIVQAMHTAAHTGDWTHEGVNAAWAPVRGATAAAMMAAPGGISILASFVLFAATTGSAVGDTAAARVANSLALPSTATVVSPALQSVVDGALYSLVCEHVLDNFVDPNGTVSAVSPQPDNIGGIGFSNVPGVGNYGPNVCGDWTPPFNQAQASSQGSITAFSTLVQAGGPLDQIAAAIARNVNGCGSVVLGTGLSPCAAAGTPANRAVFGQGGGLQNPAGGFQGSLTEITQQYVQSIVSQTASATSGTSVAGPGSLVSSEGWASLGVIYRFMGNEEAQWSKVKMALPENVAPGGFANMSTVGEDEIQSLQQAFSLTQNYINSWGFVGTTSAGQAYPFWAAVPMSESPAAQTSQIVASLSSVVTPSGQTVSLPNYMENLSEDPLSKLQNVVESADTALATVQAVVKPVQFFAAISATISKIGLPLPPALGMAAASGGDVAKSAASFFDPLSLVFIVLTFIVGVYLPLVPMIYIAFYLLFWVLDVSILALFSPFWALAAGIPQGDGFLGQHGREGLLRLTDVVIRPLLLVGMFVFSLAFYFLSTNLLVFLTSETLGAEPSIPSAGMWFSLAGMIGGYLAYTLVMWRTIHFSFEILHTGPYWAMRVLGIDGTPGREGREHEGIKEAGSWIMQNARTAMAGFKFDSKK